MDASPSPDSPTPAQLRAAFGRFPTGVTIITCVAADGRRVGLTANSLASLSLDPPLLSWSLRLSSPNLAAFRDVKHFAVNVLADAQVGLSRRFAASMAAKFDEGQWSEGVGGVPLLAGCAASFECEQFARHDAGDHQLFIGRVLRAIDRGLAPLVFNAGRYHLVGEIL
jgi:flavin reductase (DIM6/NTAB) family NADH-FMN oxidoreductase RutF